MSDFSVKLHNFVMTDHAPTQVALYSIPIVGVFIRFYQMQHIFDDIRGNPTDISITAFNAQKERIQSSISCSVKIQFAISISAFACALLFAPMSLGFTIAAHIGDAFFCGAIILPLHEYIRQSFLRSCSTCYYFKPES